MQMPHSTFRSHFFCSSFLVDLWVVLLRTLQHIMFVNHEFCSFNELSSIIQLCWVQYSRRSPRWFRLTTMTFKSRALSQNIVWYRLKLVQFTQGACQQEQRALSSLGKLLAHLTASFDLDSVGWSNRIKFASWTICIAWKCSSFTCVKSKSEHLHI